MNGTIRSIFVGTSGLTAALAVSLLLSLSRRPAGGSGHDLRLVRRVAILTVAAHFVHFLEEWQTGFPVRFPELLGLEPWPAAFFVSFNALWLAIWILCVLLLRVGSRLVLFPLWFLAIGSTLNGIAHPLLAFASGGYFPGLWTSPVVGGLGLALLWSLTIATGPRNEALRGARIAGSSDDLS